ncbi:hypothetical protein [Trichoplusia ni ascovirus 2c]|uniref:hypothetical protein n=1 Tax=Trichoplusia ni ascovirus 2c TaxID=328615 RepID=UPI0000E44260|nr:hypothetical protein TNAV2c_gp136 [Trichoplusia ni ascovirus 2c]ABF70653.1 hypothetical protein [Trichoplusia ni ascovirus 2c]
MTDDNEFTSEEAVLDFAHFFTKIKPELRRVYREYHEFSFKNVMEYIETHHPSVSWPRSNEEWFDVLESAMQIGDVLQDKTAISRTVLGLCCKYNYKMTDGADYEMFHYYMDQPCTLMRREAVDECIACGIPTDTLTSCKKVVCDVCHNVIQCASCQRRVLRKQ